MAPGTAGRKPASAIGVFAAALEIPRPKPPNLSDRPLPIRSAPDRKPQMRWDRQPTQFRDAPKTRIIPQDNICVNGKCWVLPKSVTFFRDDVRKLCVFSHGIAVGGRQHGGFTPWVRSRCCRSGRRRVESVEVYLPAGADGHAGISAASVSPGGRLSRGRKSRTA